jgi:hypothetical protein
MCVGVACYKLRAPDTNRSRHVVIPVVHLPLQQVHAGYKGRQIASKQHRAAYTPGIQHRGSVLGVSEVELQSKWRLDCAESGNGYLVSTGKDNERSPKNAKHASKHSVVAQVLKERDIGRERGLASAVQQRSRRQQKKFSSRLDAQPRRRRSFDESSGGPGLDGHHDDIYDTARSESPRGHGRSSYGKGRRDYLATTRIDRDSDVGVTAERVKGKLNQSPDSVAVRPDDVIERALWEVINCASGRELREGAHKTQDRARSVFLADKTKFGGAPQLTFDDAKELFTPMTTRPKNARIRSPTPGLEEPMTSRRHSASISPESLESLASIEPISHRILGSELLSAFLTQ